MPIEKVIFGSGLEVIIPREKLLPGTILYPAGPGGFAEATRPFHQKVVEVIKRMGAEVRDPWVLTPAEEIAAVQSLPLSPEAIMEWEKLNQKIGERNYHAICQSTGIVANCDGVDVDSGTAIEMGIGFARGLPILGYRGDFRLARDNWGGNVNLQVEYFIKNSAEGRGMFINSIVH